MPPKVKAWLMQSTTIHGMAAVAAAGVAAGVLAITRDGAKASEAAMLSWGLIAMVLPQAGPDASPVQHLVRDIATAFLEKKYATMLPALITDVETVIQAAPVATQTTVVAQQTTTTTPAVQQAVPNPMTVEQLRANLTS